MKTRFLERIALKLEPLLLGAMLLYFLDVRAHPLIVKAMKAGSYGILALLVSWRWKRFVYIATRNIPLLLLIVMIPASIFWSASPDSTLIEFKAALRGSMIGIYLATRYSMKEQMRLWTWVLGIGAVLSLVLPLALPGYSSLTRGIYGSKKAAGSTQALTSLLFLLTALKSRNYRWVAWTIFSIALVLLFLNEAKTSYSVFVISLCLLPLSQVVKQQYKLRIVLFLSLTLVIGSAIVLVLSNIEFILVDTLGKDMQLNGRIPIWTLILDKVYERPWFGYGAAGFWTSEHALYVINNSWAAGNNVGIGEGTGRFNAHSGYLEMLLQYGFVGMSLYVLSLVTVFGRVINLLSLTASVEYFWMLQTLVAFFFLNITDPVSTVGQSSFWSLYVAIAFSTALQEERIRKLHLLKVS